MYASWRACSADVGANHEFEREAGTAVVIDAHESFLLPIVRKRGLVEADVLEEMQLVPSENRHSDKLWEEICCERLRSQA